MDVIGARAAGIEAALIDAADLYADADCPRHGSLAAFAAALTDAASDATFRPVDPSKAM